LDFYDLSLDQFCPGQGVFGGGLGHRHRQWVGIGIDVSPLRGCLLLMMMLVWTWGAMAVGDGAL
jgi:hypothetical protein